MKRIRFDRNVLPSRALKTTKRTGRIVLLIGFALLLFPKNQLQAQEKFHPYLLIGGNYGLTLSSISFYPQISQATLLGKMGGLSVCFVSESHFGLQFEMNYSQRGWKEQTGNSFYQRQLNYVEVPVMTHFFTNGRIGWFLNLGPKIGYLLSQNTTTNLSKLTNPEYTMPISTKFDYGICGGTGLELHTKRFNVFFEGRYGYGLSDIFPNKASDYFGSSGNQVISITAGIMFRL